MYNLSQMKRGMKNPKKAKRELKKQIGAIKNSYYGIDFLKKDWDNLVILDGCRYDVFEEQNTLEGHLSYKFSNASATPEFLSKNFDGGSFPNTVYACANPHLNHINASFHDIIRLWETDWDHEIGTVHPRDVTDRIINTTKNYNNKRLVVHYIQPHRPFLGEEAMQIEQSGLVGDGVVRDKPTVDFWWQRLERGELDRSLVWDAYAETLEVTLPHIDRLINNLQGKTVVSADHGNAFGENEEYGHPSRCHHESLVKVPWLMIDGNDRKDIVDGQADKSSKPKNNVDVENRLAALGYLDS